MNLKKLFFAVTWPILGSWGAKIEEDTILVIFQKSRLKLRYALTHLRGQGGVSTQKSTFFSFDIFRSKLYVLLNAFYGI